MDYTLGSLKEKIQELHPEIQAGGLDLSLVYDEGSRRFVLKLAKGKDEVGAFLERTDADDCRAGKKCVNLAVQVTQMLAELADLTTPRKPG